MKSTKRKLFILLSIMMVMAMALCVPVSAKTYKAKKVTAKQITTEIGKKFKIKNVKNFTKKSKDTLIGQPNGYKTKTTFIDKKYPQIYCSIEVFKNSNLAYRRAGYLEGLQTMYDGFGLDYDVPYKTYVHKNVLIRLNTKMPTSYAKKYLTLVKKIVK